MVMFLYYFAQLRSINRTLNIYAVFFYTLGEKNNFSTRHIFHMKGKTFNTILLIFQASSPHDTHTYLHPSNYKTFSKFRLLLFFFENVTVLQYFTYFLYPFTFPHPILHIVFILSHFLILSNFLND